MHRCCYGGPPTKCCCLEGEAAPEPKRAPDHLLLRQQRRCAIFGHDGGRPALIVGLQGKRTASTTNIYFLRSDCNIQHSVWPGTGSDSKQTLKPFRSPEEEEEGHFNKIDPKRVFFGSNTPQATQPGRSGSYSFLGGLLGCVQLKQLFSCCKSEFASLSHKCVQERVASLSSLPDQSARLAQLPRRPLSANCNNVGSLNTILDTGNCCDIESSHVFVVTPRATAFSWARERHQTCQV